jgi:tetraacyldisaccharide 4'-kinase
VSGWPASLVRISRALELVNALARLPYRAGLRRSAHAEVPVVSVGNIAVGGSGKTPLVAALAHTLLELGARPVVLTRGYGRRGDDSVVVHHEPGISWARVGDEPALLARAVPAAGIVVDADRVRGARLAVERLAATHLLLDDGFQHWRLARDLDVVTLDAADPLCRRSPRREHPRTLARASTIVLTGAVREPERAIPEVRRYARDCPILVTKVVPVALHLAGEVLPPSALAGREVLAFAGIAGPGRFASSLASLGATLARLVAFPDHHAYTRGELDDLLTEATARGLMPVTTAKDAVRLPAAYLNRVAWLAVEAVPVRGTFEDLLRPVIAGLQSRP